MLAPALANVVLLNTANGLRQPLSVLPPGPYAKEGLLRRGAALALVNLSKKVENWVRPHERLGQLGPCGGR